MPCIRLGDGSGVVCLGNPTENVRLVSGRVLRLEWGAYFGPAVETKSGLRSLTDREFRDPNVDAWIVKHGGKSALDEGICEVVNGPRLPPPRRLRAIQSTRCLCGHCAGELPGAAMPTPKLSPAQERKARKA